MSATTVTIPGVPEGGLELQGIVKRWRGAPRPVLDGVDLRIEAGTLVRIDGANGAGKTTLLRIAAAIITPEAGTVRLAGIDPERDRRAFHRRLAFLAAGNTGLYARLKVRQQLEWWARMCFLPRGEREARIDAAIAEWGIEEFAGRRLDRLSMGQRQRVRLAMTFLPDPELVLLDEPRTSLDEEGIDAVIGALHGVTERGGAGVWCAPAGEPAAIDFDAHWLLSAGVLAPAAQAALR
ncbi:MAG: transporter ATP-binding protein [Solirubrobacterales bacterium]|jgi:ABC-2 type transport system ATP-binding protein|nr:transporter ATP-binding protein [Solirubrobacterales bacterium]